MAIVPSVAVCGKIRDEDSFARDLDIYADWLKNGSIRRLVFSGWVEDERHPLLERMRMMGASIVLSEPPVLKSNGHFYHQIKSLYYALQQFDDDELVLRSRTDKVWLNFDPTDVARRWSNASLPEKPSPYVRRVLVVEALVGQPFFFNDMTLMGLNGDLLKMVAFDLWPELSHALLNPEQQFHYQPYRRAGIYRSTEAFLRVNPGIITHDEALARRVGKFLLRHEIYLRALSEGLTAFERHYVMGMKEDETFVPPAVSTLDELYGLPLEEPEFHKLALSPASKSLVTKNGAAISWMLGCTISQNDRRSLRQIAQQPAPSRIGLEAEADKLARSFSSAFPDHPNAPIAPVDRNGARIIPARNPVVWIN